MIKKQPENLVGGRTKVFEPRRRTRHVIDYFLLKINILLSLRNETITNKPTKDVDFFFHYRDKWRQPTT
jgi:hypothetical protein